MGGKGEGVGERGSEGKEIEEGKRLILSGREGR